MTTLDRTPFPLTGTTRPAVAVRVVNAVVRILRAWKNRREIYHLGAKSDCELADIGLTRGDLHVAWCEPFGVDPTTTLGALAEARSIQAMRDATERAARQVC
ncbi:MAG: DUF1127 domain-containing protein [Mesorhizobium sp.]|nr:DUF1127 domain-containing protein [Mesorhizobium sp.]MCO5160354.1 DUF1127 domain-containing protein [Mesorhizobium sp.]